MRKLRTGEPRSVELWDVAEIVEHLKCDEMKAKRILDGYHRENGDGYGPVEKALILDYIERKQREEREREARYRSDLSNVEKLTALREQVKTLKEQLEVNKGQLEVLRASAEASSREARSARHWAMFASVLSVAATLAAAILPLALR